MQRKIISREIRRVRDKTIDIYTDGGCNPNGKPINKGGYAFIVVEDEQIVYEYAKPIRNTTNNKCELQAIIDALSWVKETVPNTIQVMLHSDSEYCVKGTNIWSIKWEKRNYDGVKNPEQWKCLISLKKSLPHVKIQWIKAHGDGVGKSKWNVHVDALCTEQITGKREEDKPIKKCISKADDLLLEVCREMWKDAFCTGSHGLRETITNYLKEKKLIC